MTITELAQEAGVSRDTLSDLEAGNKRPHPDTVDKVLSALDRLETEMGFDSPPSEGVADEPRVVEVRITDENGRILEIVHPVSDAPELEAMVLRLVQAMREGRGD